MLRNKEILLSKLQKKKNKKLIKNKNVKKH